MTVAPRPPTAGKHVRWIGVHLDGLGAQARAHGRVETWIGQLHPAALLPRSAGEPIRGDVEAPPHVRGSGLSWPPEATVGREIGSGRYPIAYAWERLEQDRPWRWSFEGRTREISAAEAIAAATAAVVAKVAGTKARPETVLVVPNGLSESAQEDLLDRARRQGLHLRLLWRPVAATLGWLERFGAELQREVGTRPMTGPDVPFGRVLSVHLGVEGCEVTSIPIVAREQSGQLRLLPGRRRPRKDSGSGSSVEELIGGRPPTEFLASALSGDSAGVDPIQTLWRTQWASTAVSTAVAALRGNGATDVDRSWTSAWAGSNPRFPLPAELTHPGVERRRGDLVALIRATTGTEPLLGIVLTGSLAATRVGGIRLGPKACHDAGFSSPRSLTEGLNGDAGLLTQGAARFAAAHANDEVVYLDTLPRLDVVAVRDGEPGWQPLLLPDTRWVDGGRRWRRDPPFAGLVLRNGQEVLELNVAHEEHKTVRCLSIQLPTPTVGVMPVTLDIAMEPAQGRARLEVIPSVRGAFGKRRVLAEWSAMKDTEADPKGYLDNYPRLFPPLHPRVGSSDKWRQFADALQSTIGRIPGVGAADGPLSATAVSALEVYAKALRDRQPGFFDRKTGSRDASAIDCDGVPASGIVPPALQTLTLRLCARLPGINTRGKEGKLVVRTLGYTSTDTQPFIEFLRRRLKAAGTGMVAEEVRACGWCLREPADIAVFADLALQRLTHQDKNKNWIQALSEMLRFRKDATRAIPSKTALELCEALLRAFDEEAAAGRGQYIFRTSCLSIVYLLRRRSYDDSFLEPTSRLAVAIKQSFINAISCARSGRLSLLRGLVDLGTELQRLIDYIDRKGRGLPGIGVTDDGGDASDE